MGSIGQELPPKKEAEVIVGSGDPIITGDPTEVAEAVPVDVLDTTDDSEG